MFLSFSSSVTAGGLPLPRCGDSLEGRGVLSRHFGNVGCRTDNICSSDVFVALSKHSDGSCCLIWTSVGFGTTPSLTIGP